MRQVNIYQQFALFLAATMVVGCQSVPTGTSGGRVDPYRTTAPELSSTKANLKAMLEFSEIAAGRLVLDLPTINTAKGPDGRAVLELGTIANNTQTPTGDFELMLNRLRGKLFKSDVVRRNFAVVVDRSRMLSEQQRTGATGGAASTYDANVTYLLQGDFHEAVRRERRQFYFQVTLTHLASREIVFQDDYDLGQLAQ